MSNLRIKRKVNFLVKIWKITFFFQLIYYTKIINGATVFKYKSCHFLPYKSNEIMHCNYLYWDKTRSEGKGARGKGREVEAGERETATEE